VRSLRLGILTAALTALAPSIAQALPDWVNMIDFSGYLQSDLRFEIEGYRGAVPGQGYAFQLNMNDLDLRLQVTPNPKVVLVVEPRLRLYGFVDSQTLAIADLWNPSKVDPFTVYLDSAYISVKGVPIPQIDIKAGRIQQNWGAVDIFSPTDNLNSRDFSDPLVFTRKVPNEMIEIDAYPNSWLTFNAVWVPVFQPSMLPPSAPLAFAIHDNAQGCLSSFPAPPLGVAGVAQLESLFKTINPCSLNFQNPSVTTYLPAYSIADSQAALRARMKLDLGEKGGDLDIDLSYYYGRFGFPVAYDASVQVGATTNGKTPVSYGAEVLYPRMQVAGFDFTYSAPWLFGIGLAGSLAVVFPEQVDFALGIYNNGDNILTLSHVNVPSTPFVKATIGADYTFTSWLYLNVIFVHGFMDEFNDAYGLHNYLSATPDIKLAHDVLDLRLATIVDLTDDSYVLFPQLNWIVVPAVEATFGAFWLGGSITPSNALDYASRSKFGQPAAGRSVAFLKVKATW
jgi:hypothetical protein